MKVYLCGAINGCSDSEAKDWRGEIALRLFGFGHTTLDPMRRDYRGKEDDSVQEIIEGDLADIHACDAVLVNAPKPSWGTAMELFYAYNLGKPVVIIHPKDAPVSPWLRGHSTLIVHTFREAVNYLVGVPV